MDEQLHDIDKLFKKAVELHVDSASGKVWENLEKSLQRRNVTAINKKYIKWKWVAAALFIFSAGLAMYTASLVIKSKRAGDIKHPVPAMENLQSNTAVKNGGTGNDEINNTKIRKGTGEWADDQKIVKAEYGLKKKESIAVPSKQHANKTATTSTGEELANEKDVADKKEARKTKVSRTSTALANVNTAGNNKNSKRFLRQFSNEEFQKAQGIRSVSGVIKGVAVTNDAHKKASKFIASSAATDEKEEMKPTISSRSAATINRNIDRSIGIAKVLGNLSLDSLPKTGLINNTTDGNTQTKGFDKNNVVSVRGTINRGKYTIGIFYSHGSVYNDLKSNNPDFREDNYQQIKNSEKNSIANVVGLSIERNIGRNFGIESGVSLQTFVTNIGAKLLVARRDNNGKINYRLSTSSGYAYYTIKNRVNPALADTLHSMSSSARLNYISVPVGLQYHFYLGRRITFNPAVIFSANFSTNAEVTTVQSLEHTYTSSFEGLKKEYFDARLRLEIDYYFTEKIGISITPAFTFGLSGATETNPVSTRRHSVGIAAGLNFKF